MADEANNPKPSPTSVSAGDGGRIPGGPLIGYQLPPDEASPRGAKDPARTSNQKQSWTIKKFNIYGDMPEYNNKCSKFLGFIQFGLGTVCFVLGIVLIVINAAGSHSGIGIWGGLVFIASGLVGFLSYKKPLTLLVIACFGLSLVSVVITCTMFILLCFFTNQDILLMTEYNRNIQFFRKSKDRYPKLFEERDAQTIKIAVGVVLILFAVAELVAACRQGVLAGKVFMVRGPQTAPVDNPNRISASNDVPAGEAAAGENQSWGEYNPPAQNQLPGDDKSRGKHNSPARDQQPKKQDKKSRPQLKGSGEPQEPNPKCTEIKPQKGRKAMREESQEGKQPIDSAINKGTTKCGRDQDWDRGKEFPLMSVVTRYLPDTSNDTRKKLKELFAALGVEGTQDLLYLRAKDIVPPLKLVEARIFLWQLQDNKGRGDDDESIYTEPIDDRDSQAVLPPLYVNFGNETASNDKRGVETTGNTAGNLESAVPPPSYVNVAIWKETASNDECVADTSYSNPVGNPESFHREEHDDYASLSQSCIKPPDNNTYVELEVEARGARW